MKTRINNVKKGVVTLLFAAVIAGLTACETDPVKSQRGELPDKDLLENTYVKSAASNPRLNLPLSICRREQQ